MDDTEHRDPITNVPIDQSEPDVYLAGTPTLSFTRAIERCLSMFLGK